MQTNSNKRFSWTLLAVILLGSGLFFDIIGSGVSLVENALPPTLDPTPFYAVFTGLSVLQLFIYLAGLAFAILALVKDRQIHFPVRLVVLISASVGVLAGLLGTAAAVGAQQQWRALKNEPASGPSTGHSSKGSGSIDNGGDTDGGDDKGLGGNDTGDLKNPAKVNFGYGEGASFDNGMTVTVTKAAEDGSVKLEDADATFAKAVVVTMTFKNTGSKTLAIMPELDTDLMDAEGDVESIDFDATEESSVAGSVAAGQSATVKLIFDADTDATGPYSVAYGEAIWGQGLNPGA